MLLIVFLTTNAFAKNRVYIMDGIPQGTLRVHCASKDDDLGYHDLSNGQEFMWTFSDNIWGTTLFFCHFWWGDKDKSFDVYNFQDFYVNNYWLAKPDGFYYANEGGAPFPSDKWTKKYDWSTS